jgi:hypothetical protein
MYLTGKGIAVDPGRHLYIREQHIHLDACLQHGQRLLSGRGLDDTKVGLYENVRRQQAHQRFVFNQENDTEELIVHGRCNAREQE